MSVYIYVLPLVIAISLVYYLGKYAVMTGALPVPFIADARAIGRRLFEAYIFPFEAVSILLLAAIVGALMLTGRSEQRENTTGEVIR